ncbi:MAG: tripartite tricarboxylate transporter TctB family protein [Pseudomonadota bacterium]
MLTADRVIVSAIMALSVYFMVHATVLPIGWNGMTGGPGGGAFPFWLSAIMFVCGGLVLLRSFAADAKASFSFDHEMLVPLLSVIASLIVTVALIPILGAYVALCLFLIWYLRIYGKHSWKLTLPIVVGTPIFLFFFFEVTLKILLPKGVTEPFFIPLYAAFF